MSRSSFKLSRWIVTAAYAAAVMYISVKRIGGEPPFPHFDKLVHFVMYGGLGFLFAWCMGTGGALTRTGIVVLSFALATAYGMVAEFVQLFVPTRTMEVADMAVNAVGALAGAAAALGLTRQVEAEESR